MLTTENPWHVHLGDCIEHMAALPPAVFDMAAFSPPFPKLYAYTSSDRDIGNSEDLKGDAKLHLSFFYRQLVRVMKPGRVVMVHVAQIPRMKRSGGTGLFDYRGMNIRLGERAGLVFEYDWSVRKNPQAQAIRTRSRSLQFAGLENDRAASRGSLPDYLLKFIVPGENAVPIDSDGEVSRNDWIEWAEGCWGDIRENDTLKGDKGKEEARGEGDTQHICPLQLSVIDRLIRLYSNPGELVFSPFAGIGSEGYVAIKRRRRFYGCELKPEYHAAACRNLNTAERVAKVGVQGTLPFDDFDDSPVPLATVPVEPTPLPESEEPKKPTGRKRKAVKP